MTSIAQESWKKELMAFKEKTEAFYAGEISKGEYKGFSGLYGSYAQKGGQSSMLRLRMTAGRVTKEKLLAVAEAVRKYQVRKMHFTTCQTIQLHDLQPYQVYGIMEEVLDAGIVTLGGGGDYPRNVMCSPLSGVEKGEYFNVMPWAEAAGEYLMGFIRAEKMPRKLKVGFSNSPANLTHATYRDLGFAARPDGKFDVYSAGGLGNHPRFGVLVAEAVEPEMILYYVKAMWLTFRAYGNYQNRGKARTRFMQEALGGPEEYRNAFREKLEEALTSGEDLRIRGDRCGSFTGEKAAANSDGHLLEKDFQTGSGEENSREEMGCGRVREQKQPGLYTVVWHPIGGQPSVERFCALADAVGEMKRAELRLSPDETAYIVNLTAEEAGRVLDLTSDSARSLFEASVSCVGAGICQIGIRDSQRLLRDCVEAVRTAGLPDTALPRIHISGCPSSCGTHQTGAIGFRGASKSVDKKLRPAFVLYVNGEERQGCETMGRELGTVLEEDIPGFLVKLGRTVAESGLNYGSWVAENPNGVETIAGEYLGRA